MINMLYKIFRTIFIMALVIILWMFFSHLHMRSIQRSGEYANYIYLVGIYREYISTGSLKHKDRGDIFVYTNPIMIYDTNFFPVIGIKFFINDDNNDSEIYLINNRENVILIDKDWRIKFLPFKYKD